MRRTGKKIETYKELMESYILFLTEKISVESCSNGWTQINTVYLDHSNDYISVFIKKEGDEYLLSDNCFIFSELGYDDKNDKDNLKLIMNNLLIYGIEMKNKELVLKVNNDNFPQKLEDFFQAIKESCSIIAFNKL